MQHPIWERIIRTDDGVREVMLDAALAIVLAAVATQVLRAFLAYL